jgi:Reverse transcriptase (RNA-dependent DNA polymerase)
LGSCIIIIYTSCIIVIYTDDTIITGPNPKEVDRVIKMIDCKFKITTGDKIEDFLGVNIAHQVDGSFTLMQPHVIKSILADLGLNDDSKQKRNPSVKDVILQEYAESESHCENLNYRSVIGKLNYLEKCSRPDIAYAVHQCARFYQSPKIEHTAAVKRIGRYLLATKEMGIIGHPYLLRGCIIRRSMGQRDCRV